MPAAFGEVDLLEDLPLFAGLDAVTLADSAAYAEQVELEAGSYLFHAGDAADSLYVVRNGRLQVLQEDVVVTELGRGEVIGELGLLIDIAPFRVGSRRARLHAGAAHQGPVRQDRRLRRARGTGPGVGHPTTPNSATRGPARADT